MHELEDWKQTTDVIDHIKKIVDFSEPSLEKYQAPLSSVSAMDARVQQLPETRTQPVVAPPFSDQPQVKHIEPVRIDDGVDGLDDRPIQFIRGRHWDVVARQEIGL